MSLFRRLSAGLGLIAVFLLAATTAAAAAGMPRTATGSVAPSGWVTVQQCTSVTGTITYSPGLTGTLTNQTVTLTATLSGCSNLNGAEAGSGTLTASLTGSASTASVLGLNGTATIDWPASSGLNPSNLAFGFAGPSGGDYTIGGTVSSGAFTTLPVRGTIAPITAATSGGAITKQTFTAASPLIVQENLG
jgi:hypothetical protein